MKLNTPRVKQIIYVYEDGTSKTIDIPSFTAQPTKLAPADIPNIPTLPVEPISDIYSACPKCGLRLEGVMGYCCPQPKCPTGLGGAWC